MKRKRIGCLVIFLAVCGFVEAGSFQPRGTRPNVVIILADDLGYGDLSCYGCPDIPTPNIDRLAAQGVRFTQFYSNGPECTPTRTALLSGRYQHRVGGLECAIGTGNFGRYDEAERLAEADDLGLPVSYGALPGILSGYRSACIGKWHLGYAPKHWPDRHGFDYWIGPISGGVDYFHHTEPVGVHIGNELPGDHVLYRQGKEYFSEKYMTHLITDETIGWLKQQSAENPFFLYVPYTAVHSPYQGPNDRKPEPMTSKLWNKGDRAKYAEMVVELDKGVGDICQALEKQRLADNTVVVFFSDNGGAKKGRNTPLRGNKGQLFEGGIRVPCSIRWPGRIKPGTVSTQPCMSMDLTASVAALAKAEAPEGRPFEGIDIVRHVVDGKEDMSRTLFWRARRGEVIQRAVRNGNMKYLYRYLGPDKTEEYLFDLATDPSEKNDLLTQQPERVEKLKGLLATWEKRVQNTRGM